MFGEPALASIAGLDLEPVDQIDDVVEATTGATPDAASRNGDGQMSLAGPGSADQHGIALLGKEGTAGKIAHQCLVDRCALELEVVEILGERQLGNGELVSDLTRLLLVDLGGKQITNDTLRLVLAFDGRGHDLVEGGLHAVELELAHKVEQLGAFHQTVLLRLS
jgi:hypothetical protein